MPEDARCQQPAVLSLLPFSKNAASSVSRKAMFSRGFASRSSDRVRGISVLNIPMTETEIGLKSSLIMNESPMAAIHDKKSKYESCGGNFSMDNPGKMYSQDKRRKDSQNGNGQGKTKSDRKEQIDEKKVSDSLLRNLDKNRHGMCEGNKHQQIVPQRKSLDSDLNKSLVFSLPKPIYLPPALLPTDKNYITKPRIAYMGEKSEDRLKSVNLCSTDLSSAHVRSMKLNVKELLRSETPMYETDPDKLNMQRVVEFLQGRNSEKAYEENWQSNSPIPQTSVQYPDKLPKRLSLKSAFQITENTQALDMKRPVIKLSGPSNNSDTRTSACMPRKEITPFHNSQSRPPYYKRDSSRTGKPNAALSNKAHRHSNSFTEQPYARQNEDRISVKNNKEIKTCDKNSSLDELGYGVLDAIQSSHQENDQQVQQRTDKLRNKTDTSYRLPRLSTNKQNLSEDDHNSHSKFSQDHVPGFVDNSSLVIGCFSSLDKVDKLHKPSMISSSHSKTFNHATFPVVPSNRILKLKPKYVCSSNVNVKQTRNMNSFIEVCLPCANVEPESDEEVLHSPYSTKGESIQEQVNRVRSASTFTNKRASLGTLGQEQSNFAAEGKIQSKEKGQESIAKVSREETANNAINSLDRGDDKGNYLHSDHETNGNLLKSEDSVISTTEEVCISPQFINDPITSLGRSFGSFHFSEHQKIFLRLLNQNLVARKRTKSWLEQQNRLLYSGDRGNNLQEDNSSSPIPRELVKLSLRKERNKTRVQTYMADMETRNSEC